MVFHIHGLQEYLQLSEDGRDVSDQKGESVWDYDDVNERHRGRQECTVRVKNMRTGQSQSDS